MFYFDIFSQYWPIALFAFVFTFILALIAFKVFPKLRLMDRPHLYNIKRAPIPYYGGLLLFIVFIISVLIFVPITKTVIGLLIGSFIIVILGFLDDKMFLSPFLRLFVQAAACVILIVFGIGILSINIPFLGEIPLDKPVINGVMILSALFTVFWVMAILNTMNFVDGISGLSSGVSFIAGITMFILSVHPGIHADPSSQVGIAMISLIIAMISLAFLIFDFPKPRILMGDTGSTFLGFVIATLAIFSGGKVATLFLVLGIPILDMVWVVARRIISGQKFWKGDLKHLHHRLMDIGFSERKVVAIYLTITAIFGVLAVSFVSTNQKFFVILGLLFLMILLASALVFIPRRK